MDFILIFSGFTLVVFSFLNFEEFLEDVCDPAEPQGREHEAEHDPQHQIGFVEPHHASHPLFRLGAEWRVGQVAKADRAEADESKVGAVQERPVGLQVVKEDGGQQNEADCACRANEHSLDSPLPSGLLLTLQLLELQYV